MYNKQIFFVGCYDLNKQPLKIHHAFTQIPNVTCKLGDKTHGVVHGKPKITENGTQFIRPVTNQYINLNSE